VAAPPTPVLDDVNRANDSSPPPGASWAIRSGTTNGLHVVSNALAKSSLGSYRYGNYWNQTFKGESRYCEIWVELSAVATTYSQSPGFNLFIAQNNPDLSAGTGSDGYGFDIEFVFTSSGIQINAGPYRHGAGAWQYADATYAAIVANDIIACSFDGATFKVTRYRSGTATDLISKAYNALPDDRGGLDFGIPYNTAAMGTDFQLAMDMMGSAGNQEIRVTNFGGGAVARPQGVPPILQAVNRGASW
jgi:hypothetical protein